MTQRERSPREYLSLQAEYAHPEHDHFNKVILRYLPPALGDKIRYALEKEGIIGRKLREKYNERAAAAAAKNPKELQIELVKEHKLMRTTLGTTILTLGLNEAFNEAAQLTAMKKDFITIAAQEGYDVETNRALLKKYKLGFAKL